MPYVSRFVRRDSLVLFLLALLVRLLAGLPQQQPNYMDAAYSYVNALNLAAGRGFVEDFVWNYLGQPGPPPQPSHLYWMPLTSILAWLGLALGGPGYRAAQVPFIVISALLAPISYGVARRLPGGRWQGWLAGLLAIFSGFYFPFWTAIDNFTPFAVAGSLALLLAYRGISEWAAKPGRIGESASQRTQSLRPSAGRAGVGGWAILAAGVCVGLAHLARADGPLLLAAIWPVGAAYLRRPLQVLRFSLLLALGYLLPMAPWFWRNWQVTGVFLPAAGSQTAWLPTAGDLFSSYNHLYSYGRTWSAATFFGQGPGPVLLGRWWALAANLQNVIGAWGMIFVGPLALVGAWCCRRRLLLQLAGLYAGLLFLTMTVVFAFPGALGGLFHSGAALLPFIYAAAAVGLDRAVDWAAARRHGWDRRLAKTFFGVGLLLLAVLLSGFIYYGRVLRNNAWNRADAVYPLVAAWVAQARPGATVMINNPPAYRYHGGGLSVVVPNEDIETTLVAAAEYGVDYLVLDSNHPAPLAAVYTSTFTHPGLSLVKTFGQGPGAVYVFEIILPRAQ